MFKATKKVGTPNISLNFQRNNVNIEARKRIGAQNEVMINHGTLFNDRLNMKFILTLSLYLPPFTDTVLLTFSLD